MLKPYVMYTFEKKGELKVLTREFDEVKTIDEAMAQFSSSDWLVRRSGYPSTKNMRLCIQQLDVAPEAVGKTPTLAFGNALPPLTALSIEKYVVTIRYIRKGAFDPLPSDIGEMVLGEKEYEGDVVAHLSSFKDATMAMLDQIAQTGEVDAPTLCIYYPTNHVEKHKAKGKTLLKEKKAEAIFI